MQENHQYETELLKFEVYLATLSLIQELPVITLLLFLRKTYIFNIYKSQYYSRGIGLKNGNILQIAGIISLVVIIALITISIASSLSVGGIAYSSDSETCANCHGEVPYVEGYKNSSHSNGDVTCMNCHQYSSPIKDKDCLTCHEDDYRRDNGSSTKFNWDWASYLQEVDAHQKGPHIGVRCTNCHLEHKFQFGIAREALQSRCFDCHIPIPEGADLSRYAPAP